MNLLGARKLGLGFGTAALLVSLAFLAASCGGKSSSSSKPKGGDNTITVNWGTEPPSLDPGLATDTTSANILQNIMDPLVKLGPAPGLKPMPNLAQSWQLSDGGKTVTFKLRSDGRWTNGDPVTANDFEYSWKRTISPELAADYAYQFFGIVGAQEYNSCKSNCDALKRQGRRQGSRPAHAAGQADLGAAVVRPAGRTHVVPRGQQEGRRAVRRQVDRGEEHRHGRPVQARAVAARLADRPRQERRLA